MYGVNLLLTMVMVSVAWRYAVRAHLVRPDLGDEDVKTLTQRLTPTLGVYVVMSSSGCSFRSSPCSGTWRSRSSSSCRSAPCDTATVIADGDRGQGDAMVEARSAH